MGSLPNASVVAKNYAFRFVENREVSAQTSYRWNFVSVRHGCPRPEGGAMAEEYAISSTTLMVVEVCWLVTRCLMWIKSTAHFSVTCMRHGSSHARYAIVGFIATMRVQSYAGSWIKRVSCWKCSAGWHAICLRYSYNRWTTFQLMQSVARVSQR